MSFSLVQTNFNEEGPESSCTAFFLRNTTSGNTAIVAFAVDSGITITPPAGWSEAVSKDLSGHLKVDVFYQANCGVFSNRSFTFSGTSNTVNYYTIEYSGFATSSPVDRTAVNSGTSTTTADSGTTATTTQANELWLAILANDGGRTYSGITNSFVTESSSSTPGYHPIFLDKTVSSTGAANTGATLSGSANYAGVIVTFTGPPIVSLVGTAAAINLTASTPILALNPEALSGTTAAINLTASTPVMTADVLLISNTAAINLTASNATLILNPEALSGTTAVIQLNTSTPTLILNPEALSGTAAAINLAASNATLILNPEALSGTTAVIQLNTSTPILTNIVPLLANTAAIQLNASMPILLDYASSLAISTYIKQQLVKVYNSSGVFIDVWRDAPLLDGFKEAVESATTPIRVKLPRRFDNFDEAGTVGALGSVAQGNIVKWYLFGPGLPATGYLRYQGVIDAYEPTIDDNGEEFVTVTVTPRGSAVGDVALAGDAGFGSPDTPATYVDPVTMFNYWFLNNDPNTGNTYAAPLTLDGTNPASSGSATQYTFSNQQLADIWDTVLLLLPTNWFWRINIDYSVTLNIAPVTPQNMFILGRHCVSLLYTNDWTQLKNVIFVQGGQDPVTGLTITATAVGSDISVYDARYLLVSESRIVDQYTAQRYADALLAINDQVQFRVQLRIFDYRGDPNVGLGYDIESIKVGQTCLVQAAQTTTIPPTPQTYWDQGVWDVSYWDAYPSSPVAGTSLWDVSKWDVAYWDFAPGNALGQILEIVGITYHFDYVDLELVALRPSQDVALARFQAQLQSNSLAPNNKVAVWG